MIGVTIVVAAIAATQGWLDRHFLPSFFVPRIWYVRIESAVRLLLVLAGVGLVAARSRIAQALAGTPAATMRIVVAAALAIVAGELAVRFIQLRPTEWLVSDEEPRRQEDSQLGWVLAPARVGRSRIGGRTIEYAIDPAGYRVRALEKPVDPQQPAIVFAGESVMFGEGLTWDESIPAQTGATVGAQAANIAVHGYSTDQIYLRLARELPRFRQPIAIVAIFMTELFGRNLDDDRPHLAPGLVWQPAEHTSRLLALTGMLVPFRRDETVIRGVAMSREVLRAIVHVGLDRHAMPLVVVPQFGPEDAAQRALRERVIADDVPSLLVPLDPGWRLPWDRHPNARAAHVIAAAIATALAGRLQARVRNPSLQSVVWLAPRQVELVTSMH